MNTCGNCKFGTRVNAQQIECHGAPPHGLVIPGQDPEGRPQLRVEFIWPLVLPTAHGCSLWAFRLVTLADMPAQSRA